MIDFKSAADDLRQTRVRFELAWELALDDIRQRYKRTALGPFWLVLGIGLWVGMTGFIGTTLFRADFRGYFTDVAIGMVLWIFLANLISEGVTLIQSNGTLILNTNVPMGTYFLRLYLKHLLLFLHFMIIPLGVILFVGVPYSVDMLWILPGFVLYSLTAISFVTILAFLCARFRDVQQAVMALLNVIPLVTPILWRRDFLPEDKKWIADFNPLYHYIEIIRGPVAGHVLNTNSIVIVASCTVVIVITAFLIFSANFRKAAFWI